MTGLVIDVITIHDATAPAPIDVVTVQDTATPAPLDVLAVHDVTPGIIDVVTVQEAVPAPIDVVTVQDVLPGIIDVVTVQDAPAPVQIDVIEVGRVEVVGTSINLNGDLLIDEVTITQPGATVYFNVVPGVIKALFTNGLLESTASYNYSGNAVSLDFTAPAETHFMMLYL